VKKKMASQTLSSPTQFGDLGSHERVDFHSVETRFPSWLCSVSVLGILGALGVAELEQ
jgi:hypothetical protein